jgi:hypothetical protein
MVACDVEVNLRVTCDVEVNRGVSYFGFGVEVNLRVTCDFEMNLWVTRCRGEPSGDMRHEVNLRVTCFQSGTSGEILVKFAFLCRWVGLFKRPID